MKMSNEQYDFWKKISLIIGYSLVTLISAVTEIWSIPHGAAIAGTVGAIGVFIGSCLTISSKHYNPDDDKEQS